MHVKDADWAQIAKDLGVTVEMVTKLNRKGTSGGGSEHVRRPTWSMQVVVAKGGKFATNVPVPNMGDPDVCTMRKLLIHRGYVRAIPVLAPFGPHHIDPSAGGRPGCRSHLMCDCA